MISPVGKDNAFSLFELLVVLSLLGLGSLIVLPSIDRGLRGREARQSALELAAVARDLRSRAIYDNTLQRLILNASENSYEPLGRKKVLLSSDIRITGMDGGDVVREGVRQFLFFPNGSALGGEVGISGGEGIAYVIRLDSLSGRVVVEQLRRR
ncbi:MAG: prepilin-type N-terminal cleavage/methylation domain-containing protein [Candidatus Binatia bacterium]